MQVHVDDVEPHVTRPHLAQNGIEVGAVVVQQATGLMHDVGNLLDAPFEHAEGAGIGQHDAGGLRSHRRLQRLDIDIALVVGRHLARHVAEHCRRGRIGAVRRVRHQYLGAPGVAPRPVIGTDHRHAGEFTLGAGHGRKAYAGHAGDVLEDLLQVMHARQKALRMRHRGQRVPAGKPRQQGQGVTGARVVFHRARTQRIEVRVDGKIQPRQLGVVAHHLQFGNLRQQRRRAAAQGSGNGQLAHRVTRHLRVGGTARRRFFEDQALDHVRSSESVNQEKALPHAPGSGDCRRARTSGSGQLRTASAAS